MLPDHPLGDAGLEQVRRAAVMLVTKHDQVDIALSCALQDDFRHVMLGRAYHFAMRVDACCGQSIDQPLHCLAVRRLHVILRRQHAEMRPRDDVAGHDVSAREMQHVHGRAGQTADLLGPGQGGLILLGWGRVDRHENAFIHLGHRRQDVLAGWAGRAAMPGVGSMTVE
jgi:hypothetical protein